MDVNARVEDLGAALLAVRRALTQSLVDLPDGALWRSHADGGPSIAATVLAAAAREGEAFWPPDLPSPALPARPALVGVFYALVRYRAVTEEVLMGATDADMVRPYRSAAVRRQAFPAQTLESVLADVMASELAATARVRHLRGRDGADADESAAIWMAGVTAFAQCMDEPARRARRPG